MELDSEHAGWESSVYCAKRPQSSPSRNQKGGLSARRLKDEILRVTNSPGREEVSENRGRKEGTPELPDNAVFWHRTLLK